MNETGSSKLSVGYLEVEPGAYRAALHGRILELTPSQVAFLSALVRNRDRVVSRAELAEAAGLVQRGSVDVVLSSLRRLLGEGFVRNVRNRGWILEPTAFES
jgi:DNA-binding response OmpR family regulator